ncbi:molybdopterin molybdenumtransferase MoeA [Comamonas phosphati]|nr:molybdopterin molybdenumtransferase MoeA [Comamonas phosphati]
MTASFQPAAHSAAQSLTADQVRQQLSSMLRTLGPVPETETLPLLEALDRILAEDVLCPVNVPPHDNSAMDGYAFHGQELALAAPELRLRVVGTALAGKPWQGRLQAGDCVKIMTGAVMPAGLDTVVPHEQVQAVGDEHIRFATGRMGAGDNRRLRGEDLRQGAVALVRGQRLTPAALGLLASLGLVQVTVRRRLRVAYFSTGDEILSPGSDAREGAIYDSNRFSLQGLLRRMGADVLDLGVVADEPAALEERLREASALADVILTSGGISAGEADHTRAMLQRLGPVQFWRIAMRPGRPLAAGLLQPRAPAVLTEKNAAGAYAASAASSANQSQSLVTSHPAVLLGLPGNPVAAMVSFLMFVRPALLQLMGSSETAPVPLQVAAAEPLSKRPGRTEYQRGIVELGADGRATVRTTGPQGSGVLSSMVAANAIIVLHEAQADVQPGDMVSVIPLTGLI